ncbi:MAG: hypothetical protein KF864_11680 [Phycisphaeraceae bacterium]|nr:hypothetical protein [Phycisphaeraceae bacterium]
MEMLEGRQRHDWSIASSYLSVIANLHRDPKRSRRLKPSDFDPFAQRSHAQRPITVPISVLKDVFIDGKVPRIAQEDLG